MPEWTIFVAAGVAMVGALVVGLTVSRRSAHSGESLPKEWLKSGLFGGLTMIGVLAAFLIIANVVNC
jgi:hypothetical protein